MLNQIIRNKMIGERNMNWTKKKNQKKVDFLFKKKLVPIAEKLKKNGVTPFTTKFESDKESYFIDSSHSQMTREYFECLGSGSDREILECLKKQWSERGWNELIPLIAEFESLVERYSSEKQERKDVDPFIYTMH